MIIYVDIDQVLNDLIPKTLAFYNSHTGKNIQPSDITEYKLYDCLPQEDAYKITELFKNKDLWETLSPLPDSQWGIKTLINMGHKVILATATHESNFEPKCNWIMKYYPMISSEDIIRIYDKSLLRGDILIDDCLENLTSSYCERICLDYLYNRNQNKDDIYEIYRANDWKDIIKFVKEIERKMDEWAINT